MDAQRCEQRVRLHKAPRASESRVIEGCNFVDAGTSVALLAQARDDFHEQTAIEAVISFLQTYGRPRQMTFDRDPRWVGGSAGRDFPSPLRRLLLCLGIEPHICPPHRPDKNAYVERYHRTYGQECLQRYQPTTLQQVTRPSPRRFSSITIGSVLDPRPDLWQCPAAGGLSDLANLTSPPRAGGSGWLVDFDSIGRCICAMWDAMGVSISIWRPTTSARSPAGRTVLLQVLAENRQFAVWHQDQLVKRLPIKGPVGQEMVLPDYLKYIQQEALAAPRRSPAHRGRQSPAALSLG